ncbi:glucodextranase DOMON-like domain-containing protein [Acidothermaceae bacterium B102]|nr:glucodextranase DOMON-like domain-containing protein [Acidothermaceae bacterium B102]
MRRFARSVVVPLSVASAVAAVTGLAGPLATARAVDPAPSVGAVSHFDQARKDCLGTARNTTSKIWYTVANGVLSDVYAPTIDTTNVETMQYVVTDGSTFTDLQTRDTTYKVASDPTGMVCTVTATAKSGRYRLVTTYLTDTDRSSVVVHTQFVPLTNAARHDKVYVRLDATVGGNGGGGTGNAGADTAVVDTSTGSPVPVSYDTNTATNAANRDYAVPSFLALRADHPFTQVSSGFVGTPSDGLVQLDAAHALTPTTTASNGNVEQTAGVSLGHDRDFTLALGFGTTQQQAVSVAGASVHRSWGSLVASYALGWLRYDVSLRTPTASFFANLPGLTSAQTAKAKHAYYVSANVVKASEDKTFPGAIVASLASPWGQAVSAGDPNNTYFGSYREVFARDLYEAWTALYTDGDIATARDTVRFLFLHQQLPDGSMPRNSLVNGKTAPDSFNTQLDEAAYPILMALQSGLSGDDTLWPHIKAAANFVAAKGPAFGPERWEEQSGYSPSTIAAEIAGLVAGAQIAKAHGDDADARVWLATADLYQRSIKAWSVTTTGTLNASGRYFIRLSPTGDPNAAETLSLGNGGPTLDQRQVIDAGFLELVRLGELSPTDPDVTASLKVVDATIERTTPTGIGWLRYNNDGYGDCYLPSASPGGCVQTGSPWAPSNKGTGHIWPVLAAERAQQDQAAGDAATAGTLLKSINDSASGVGLVPEQVWDDPDVPASPYGTDPTTASIGFTDGQATGSAAPLTWGAASEVRLTADLGHGRSLEQPAAVKDRYVTHSTTTTDLTVTAPANNTATNGNTDTVVGTATPGDTIDIGVVGTDAGGTSSTATATVPLSGSFSVPVTVGNGTSVLVITATSPTGGTAQTTRTVDNDVVVGTLLFDATDPSNDDNGPGNYAYPTSSNFVPGAYDLQDFQVYDTGSTVTFRVQTRDLSPTFGSPLGAQLVDVYVSQPGASPTSTQAAYTSRNYTLANPWSRRIEVQGFGQQFVDAAGNTVGSVTISGNPISRYITFSVDKAALGGAPTSGWAFNVVLTGQDGFSADNARGFQPVPQDFQFGVCAVASLDPHCTAAPGSVPKAVDVLTPSGVSQATELDYTLGPVVLQGVAIP